MDPMEDIEQATGTLEPPVPADMCPWVMVGVGTLRVLGLHAGLRFGIRRMIERRSGVWISLFRRMSPPPRLFAEDRAEWDPKISSLANAKGRGGGPAIFPSGRLSARKMYRPRG